MLRRLVVGLTHNRTPHLAGSIDFLNALLLQFDLGWLKPFLTALLLPPVPFLLLAATGAWISRRRRRRGGALIALSLMSCWISACTGFAERLGPVILPLSPALSEARIDVLRREARQPVAIVVLGGGVEEWAPEYSSSNLRPISLERLRYGLWLARRTGWPTGFSGGIGWAQTDDGAAREATVAQRIATSEFRQPLRWIEDASRDTRENARRTAALLQPFGISHLVLVTHDWHMPRAQRDFEQAFGSHVQIEAAPIGLARDVEKPLLQWLPSNDGATRVRHLVRERLGLIAGS